MFRYLLMASIMMIAITPSAAEEKEKYFDFHNDRFFAGATVVQNKSGVDDLFMFGETVRSEEDIAGSAHLVGRKVVATGDIGGDAYLAGMDISVEGKVAGDVTVSGYNVRIGEVAGDVRASGANLTLSGPVNGYALVAGDEVRFESVVKGDVSMAARELEFADNARIEGKLTLYEQNKGETEISADVISEDRIERRDMGEWSEVAKEMKIVDWRYALLRFLLGVVVVAGLAALTAAIAPQKLAELRRAILDRPMKTLWFGILAQSVIIGLTILLMMTLIGLLLVPATVFVALVTWFAGYVVASYALGVALLMAFRQQEPDTVRLKALAAGIGALTVGLIALIPFFGWLFALAVALTGVGAISIWLVRPKFFASA